MSMTFFCDGVKQISYMICINHSQNLIFVMPLLNLSNPMKQNHSIEVERDLCICSNITT